MKDQEKYCKLLSAQPPNIATHTTMLFITCLLFLLWSLYRVSLSASFKYAGSVLSYSKCTIKVHIQLEPQQLSSSSFDSSLLLLLLLSLSFASSRLPNCAYSYPSASRLSSFAFFLFSLLVLAARAPCLPAHAQVELDREKHQTKRNGTAERTVLFLSLSWPRAGVFKHTRSVSGKR